MSILTQAPLASHLDRLFSRAGTATSPASVSLPRDERERVMRSRTDDLSLDGQLKNLWLPVSRDTGRMLYMLARAIGARHVGEFGTSFGISTLHLAAALRENGGGRPITTGFEPSKVAKARGHLEEAGLADLVDLREGDALKTLAVDLPDGMDRVVLDGAKALCADILALVESTLRPGAFVVADNTDCCPDDLARVRAQGSGYMSVPVGDDVELSLRLA